MGTVRSRPVDTEALPQNKDLMASEPCKVIVINHLTLDGVYQAPAREDEDTRGGFAHGGWAKAGDDPELQGAIGKYMAHGWSLLVGSTTYADLYEGWHVRQPDHPMTRALTDVQKFVTSRDPHHPLPWKHSTLLAGDAAVTVGKLKAEHDKPLVVFGSGVLVRALMERQLVDELVLMIHPLILGTGRRFFDAAPRSRLTLADQRTTRGGLILATYKLAA